jgi:hypothetical protein
VKKFMDLPASMQVPMEGEVDIYPGAGFLEVEVEGPYTMLAAGASVSWSVQWRVAKIPSAVTVSSGSATLADFAKQLAAL